MNRVVLLRHGRTRYNAEARLQGQIDSDLDEIGTAQAKAAGAHILSTYEVTRVVTSSLQRTRQTVEAAGLDRFPVRVDDRWREIDFGDYDTRLIADVMTELGQAWSADIDHVPKRGESMAALHERVGSAWREVFGSLTTADDGVVVVVGHATPIKSALVHAMGGSAPQILRLWLSLGSVSIVRHSADEGAVIERFNDIGHLP